MYTLGLFLASVLVAAYIVNNFDLDNEKSFEDEECEND